MLRIEADHVTYGVVRITTPKNIFPILKDREERRIFHNMIGYRIDLENPQIGFAPDEDQDFSGLILDNFLLVTRSKYAMPAPFCSPCFEMFGDLEAAKSDCCQGAYKTYAYSLPPEIWGSKVPETLMEVIF